MLLEDLKGSGISLWKTNLAMRRDDAMMSTNPPNTTPTTIPTTADDDDDGDSVFVMVPCADVVVCVGPELGLVVEVVVVVVDVVVVSVKNDSLFPGGK